MKGGKISQEQEKKSWGCPIWHIYNTYINIYVYIYLFNLTHKRCSLLIYISYGVYFFDLYMPYFLFSYVIVVIPSFFISLLGL